MNKILIKISSLSILVITFILFLNMIINNNNNSNFNSGNEKTLGGDNKTTNKKDNEFLSLN